MGVFNFVVGDHLLPISDRRCVGAQVTLFKVVEAILG